ncbi:PAS domain S-box protein [Kovacikia minuta CCNUW1]|uniref:PAS domain-containing protein n=1 Tax=Kovacikia minuta TaxID=2931930 RepID=UPI001CCADEA4|nr:PAS domain S-box protein [Kovacikia minuta]UBF24063.1 PAS domain S-box protein [Kovacikia minuta CCNUW1]
MDKTYLLAAIEKLNLRINRLTVTLAQVQREKAELETLLEDSQEPNPDEPGVEEHLEEVLQHQEDPGEESFELILEAAPVAILVTEMVDGTVLYANSSFAKTFDVAPEAVLGSRTVDFYFDPTERQKVLAIFAKERRVQNYELQCKKPDGTPVWVIFSLRPFLFHGKPTLLIALCDITDRKQAEEALKQTRDELQAILNAIPGAVSWIDSNGCYLGVKQQLADTFNLSPMTFVGQEVGFLGSSPQYVNFIRQFLESQEASASQVVEMQVDQGQQYYLIVAQKYRQGKEIVSVGIDITERKQAEESLRIAEENYRSIFENAVEGIFQTTPNGQYIRVNPAMARMHGYDSPQDMIANITEIDQQIYVHPQKRQEFKRLLEAQGEVKGVEYQVYRRDGSIFWVCESARAVRDANGKVLYYEGTSIEVTERKLQEEALKRQLELLQLEIDQTKRERQVAEIIQSNYFKELQAEVDRLQRWDND